MRGDEFARWVTYLKEQVYKDSNGSQTHNRPGNRRIRTRTRN
jgi:hypothetical protein